MNANAKPSGRSRLREDFIPASDYVSPEIHRLERERLWPRVWQIACREEEIPRVGDYVNYEIQAESILIVRSAPDAIHAIYNVCSHRGRRLRDDARGNVPVLRCNYHAWQFDLQGKFLSAPCAEDWRDCPEFTERDLSLRQIKVDTWAGFVWINMDPNCGRLQDFLGPLPDKLDVFEIDKCRLHAYWTLHIPVNWKVVLEAFIEGYHTNGTHPQMLKYGKPHFPAAAEDLSNSRMHATHTAHFEPLPDMANPECVRDARKQLYDMVEEIHRTLGAMFLQPAVAAARRVLTEVTKGTPGEMVYERFLQFDKEETEKMGAHWPSNLSASDLWSTDWQIFPNSSVLPTVDGALWYRMRPNGEDEKSCIFDIWGLGRFAPGKEPKVSQQVFQSLDEFAGTSPFLEQDFRNLIAVQKGMRSQGWRGARPNPVQERSVCNFHRVLHDYLYGGNEA